MINKGLGANDFAPNCYYPYEQMNKMYYRVLSIGIVLFALFSCTGNNNSDQQQVVVPTVQEQPAQAPPVDSTQAQAQAAVPAAATPAVPEAVSAFVKQYFPNATIAGVELDNDHGGVEYDVYLNDGTQIDFDTNNQWDKVECYAKGVPAALIPQAIATHVKSNYQNMVITKIDREHYGYEIELSNGLDLKFDKSGHFMGIDD